MAVLEGRDVTKTYREGRHEVPVLHGVSLAVARGEVVALDRPLGLGQDHAALHPGLPAHPHRRPGRGRRTADRRRPSQSGSGRSGAARSASSSSNSTCSRR